MAAVVKYLHSINGRWKYRRVVPPRLRAHIDGNIGEFVRWLGAANGQPSPEVLRRYVEVGEEFEALVAMAEKRAAGQYDDLTEDVIEHFIATVRSHMLEEDEEERFDEAEDELFEAVRRQLEGNSRADISSNPDRRFEKRQEGIDWSLEAWRADLARGHISDFFKEELFDRAEGYGLRLDADSLGFRRLAKRFLQLLVEFGEAAKERQEGKLVPTPKPPAPLTPEKRRGLPDQTISGLVEGWWKEAKAAGRSLSTFDAYSRTARQFAAFLEHDDANAVSKKDVLAFKDHRLEHLHPLAASLAHIVATLPGATRLALSATRCHMIWWLAFLVQENSESFFGRARSRADTNTYRPWFRMGPAFTPQAAIHDCPQRTTGP